MNYLENKLSDEIIKQVEQLVDEYSIGEFNFSRQTRIPFGENRIYYIDLAVQLNSIELYFELTSSIKTKISSNFTSLANFISRPNRYFIVYTPSGKLHLIDEKSDFKEFDSLFQLYSFITKSFKRPRPTNKLLKEIFSAAVSSFSKETKSVKIKNILKLLDTDSFENDLKFDNYNDCFFFTNDIRNPLNFENKFFNCLIEELKIGDRFYRYGDLKLALYCIKEKTCRFSGIPGMNDISEIGYVDNYLDKNFIPLQTQQDVININSKFILCSSLLKDNLTQWRLYGDDCKGTSIEYEVTKSSIDFIIKKISYGVELNGENYHLELEIIRFIQEEFYSTTGHELKFRTLDIWKHFFKSFEYSIEEEVRVLYICEPKNTNINWNLTYTHNILNPFITFGLNEIPMEIKTVFFGAKCPEKEINLMQFKHLSIQNGQNFIFKQSRIKNYR